MDFREVVEEFLVLFDESAENGEELLILLSAFQTEETIEVLRELVELLLAILFIKKLL